MRRRRQPDSICPRCGLPGFLQIESRGSRKYLIYYHYIGDGKYHRCYIGPCEKYVYCEKLHTIGLSNLGDVNYAALALLALARFKIKVENLKVANISESISYLERIKELADEIIEKLKMKEVSSNEIIVRN